MQKPQKQKNKSVRDFPDPGLVLASKPEELQKSMQIPKKTNQRGLLILCASRQNQTRVWKVTETLFFGFVHEVLKVFRNIALIRLIVWFRNQNQSRVWKVPEILVFFVLLVFILCF